MTGLFYSPFLLLPLVLHLREPGLASPTDKKTPSSKMALGRHNFPLGVIYIEVGNTAFANVGCYSLKTKTGQPLFDIGIIFASNINYDRVQKRAVLFHNGNVQGVLDGVDIYVRPLQAKGIKVLLSILGNHGGAGISNFETQTAARDFAVQLANAVNQYGLDGIDFDDEYADYWNSELGQPNRFSFIYLLKELRQLLPDKIISLYFCGPATGRLSYDGMVAGDFLDYSWNAIHGSFSIPFVPLLDQNQLGAAAINVVETSVRTAQDLATNTVNGGYGVFLYYNLPNTSLESYLSGISNRLYRVGTELKSGCLSSWPFRNGTGIVHPENSSRGRRHIIYKDQLE